jgi:hypothetical protein
MIFSFILMKENISLNIYFMFNVNYFRFVSSISVSVQMQVAQLDRG